MGRPAWVGGKPLASTDNFLEAPIKIICKVTDETGREQEEAVEWRSCEHFFQAAKFDSSHGTSTWEHCRKIQQDAKSPLDAWSLGQSRTHPLRRDWEAVKAHPMYIAIRAKYEQYPEYASEFANTTEPVWAKQ